MNNGIFGKEAYEAYCVSSNNKSLVSGCELPIWEDLKPEIKMAWVAAASAVVGLNVLNLQPTDILVLKVHRKISENEIDMLKEQVKLVVPNNKVTIINQDFDFEIIKIEKDFKESVLNIVQEAINKNTINIGKLI